MKDIMIDIETLGESSRSVITALAAVAFDIDTGETGAVFHYNIDIQSCLYAGLQVTGGTLKWWISQSPEARDAIVSGKSEELTVVLKEFTGFVQSFPDAKLWGNGSRFDLGILADAYRAVNLDVPWIHSIERDVRTLVSLHPDIKKNTPFLGVRHNPIDDCFHQIRYCSETWREVNQSLSKFIENSKKTIEQHGV